MVRGLLKEKGLRDSSLTPEALQVVVFSELMGDAATTRSTTTEHEVTTSTRSTTAGAAVEPATPEDVPLDDSMAEPDVGVLDGAGGRPDLRLPRRGGGVDERVVAVQDLVVLRARANRVRGDDLVRPVRLPGRAVQVGAGLVRQQDGLVLRAQAACLLDHGPPRQLRLQRGVRALAARVVREQGLLVLQEQAPWLRPERGGPGSCVAAQAWPSLLAEPEGIRIGRARAAACRNPASAWESAARPPSDGVVAGRGSRRKK